MRLRHWLLIGSSVSLMTIAPAGITVAQDAGLTDACVAAGITTPDDCAAFEKKGGAAPEEQAPAEEAAPPAEAPAPAQEEAAPPAEQQAPAEEAAPPAEQAAPPAEAPAPAEEAAPPAEEQAAPPAEAPAPAQEEAAPPAEQQAPAEEAAPPAEEQAPAEQAAPPAEQAPAPAEQQAPAEQAAPPAEEPPAPAEQAPPPAEQPPAEQAPAPAEQPPAEQQAPAPQEQPAPEQPAPEQPAPAVPEQQPSPQQPAPAGQGADIGTDLQAAVANYQNAVAGLIEAQTGGGDVAAAQADIADAKGQVDSLCSQGGFGSTDECLAQYGLTLPNVPGGAAPAEQPAAPAEQPPAQPGAEQPAAGQPGEAATPPSPEQVQEELQNDPALQDQPKEDVTNLPAGVDPNAVAPLLDSAKDEVTAIESGTAPAEEQQAPAAEGQQPQEQQQPAEQAGPPPDSDAAAQAAVQVQPQEVDPVSAEEGQRIDAPPPVEVPQNVTIVNNNTTVVNNSTSVTNNVTNNTVNNNVTNNTVNAEVNNTQIVMQVGDRLVISNPQQERARFVQQDDEVYYEQLSGGRVRETVQRPDGSKVVTIRNRYGEVLQRSRVTQDGREYILAYYTPQADQEDQDVFYTDPGANLPPLRLNIPVDQYVLDASRADEQQLQSFLLQPPVEPVRRLYTISEVKNSARIRDSVRRLEIGGLTFDTGKATISRDQVGNLSQVAAAMQAVLKENPAETFLIEGHTDAVGSDLANLRLSDLRANTVAQVLTDFYDIPPENLATQGYGERYLKIRTEAAERENRRVTIRRITPLITPVANR